MTQVQKALVVLLVATLGIWGCAQGPAGASAEKVRSLEGKVARLEEDFRSAAAARDQFRKKLTEAESTTARLKQEVDTLQPVLKERDDLLVQLKSRIAERDAVNAQFEVFRKSLKELIGQTEASISKPGPSINTVSQQKKPNL
ncbi:MAG: hypothetical protein ACJ8F7_08095 [Gemmataceae bacterium]